MIKSAVKLSVKLIGADLNWFLQITVCDVLGWLAARISVAEIIDDFPELRETDIQACLEFAADCNHPFVAAVSLCLKLLFDQNGCTHSSS